MAHETVAFIGDLTVDNYKNIEIDPHYGGSSLNNAVWALRSGATRVSVIAAVGDDEAGKSFLKKMHEEHVDSTGVTALSGETSTIEIFIDPASGERSLRNWRAGVLEKYHLGKKEFDLLRLYTSASLTIYRNTKHLISELSQWGEVEEGRPFLAVNFGDLSHFDHSIDIVIANIGGIDAGFFGLDKETDKERIREIQLLAKDTKKLMVVTLGNFGAIAFDRNSTYEAPIIPLPDEKVKDKTGAGDAFLAGFIVDYMKYMNIQTALEAGNRIAAQKIQILGAY
jgi:sugar/nucleoside kinase (ribokinase family)